MKLNKYTLLPLLTIPLLMQILISCSDFVDEKTPEQQQPPSKEQPKTPKPNTPTKTPHQPLTEEQRKWRMCEAERLWAFNAKLIDSHLLRIYQERNMAPVFNHPGERQSGIEGWYSCNMALGLNGFYPSDVY